MGIRKDIRTLKKLRKKTIAKKMGMSGWRQIQKQKNLKAGTNVVTLSPR